VSACETPGVAGPLSRAIGEEDVTVSPPPESLEAEERVLESADSTGIPYEVVPCDPEFADTAQFCERYGYPPENAANTIVVASKKEPKRYVSCVVQATRRLDVNKTVRRLMGVSRASFARPDETAAVTGMLIGGVTVFALPEEMPVYIDEALMGLDYVILGAGSRSSKIKAAPEILKHVPNAEVIDGLSLAPTT